MTRFGVMKHLRILEDAGLITTRREGREKRHFLNPVPIRLIHDRWIDRYTERRVSALIDLKHDLESPSSATVQPNIKQTEEGEVMTAAAETRATTVQVHRVFIKAPAQKVWDAIVQPGWAEKYGYACRAEYDLRPGGAFKTFANDAMKAHGVPDGPIIVGEIIEADPPKKLVQTWHPIWDPVGAAEAPTRLTYEIEEQPAGICRADDHPRRDRRAVRREDGGGRGGDTLAAAGRSCSATSSRCSKRASRSAASADKPTRSPAGQSTPGLPSPSKPYRLDSARLDATGGPMHGWNGWIQDGKYALRSLASAKRFAAIVIATLALGIGANTAVFSVLHAVVLQPLPYDEPDRLVRVYQTSGADGQLSVGPRVHRGARSAPRRSISRRSIPIRSKART